MANIPFLNNSYFSAKVGIGTEIPLAKLSLGASTDAVKLLLYDNSNNYKFGFGIQTDEFRQFYPDNGHLSIGTIAAADGSTFSEKVLINSAGDITTVGQVAGTVGDFSSNVFVGGADSLFSENNLRFKSAGAAYIDHNTVGQSFMFRTSTTTALDTPALTIHSSGTLDVSGLGDGRIRIYPGTGAADPSLELLAQGAVSTEGFRLRYDNSGGDTYFDNIWDEGVDANPAIRFRTKTNGTAINAITIAHGGNVGIGTTSPDAGLEIEDSTSGKVYNLSLINNYDTSAVTASKSTINFGRNNTTERFAEILGGQQSASNYNYGSLSFGTRTTDVLGVETKMTIAANGAIQFNSYSGALHSGTPTYVLGTDASGNVVKSNKYANYNALTFADGTEKTDRSTVNPAPSRTTNPNPSSYGRTFNTEFKAGNTIGSPVGAEWTGLISMAPYQGTSTFYTTQLAFRSTGSNENMYIRQGVGTTWGSWNMILTTSNSGTGPFLPLTAGSTVPLTGDLYISSAKIASEENTDIDIGTEVIAQVAIADFTAAFFDFVVKKGTNVRSGTVYACHDGTNVEYAETSTVDLGDTSDLVLTVDISAGSMRLLGTAASVDWSVKSLIRAL